MYTLQTTEEIAITTLQKGDRFVSVWVAAARFYASDKAFNALGALTVGVTVETTSVTLTSQHLCDLGKILEKKAYDENYWDWSKPTIQLLEDIASFSAKTYMEISN